MNEATVWDGVRPPFERQVISRRDVMGDGISLSLAREDVSRPTDWCFDVPHHVVVVHLAGRMRRMETVFSSGYATDALPCVGDIWTIPAGCRYAALAEGSEVGFAEFSLTGSALMAGSMVARTGHRDDFLYHASARACELAARDDDLARMSLQSLLRTLTLHLQDRYLHGAAPARRGEPPKLRHFSVREKQLVMQRVADSMQDEMTVDDLAMMLGLSTAHVMQGFKASFGTTPWQYVLGVRLDEARRLLDYSHATVSEIAGATGFSSPGHLATTFAKRFGMSPTVYRRRAER